MLPVDSKLRLCGVSLHMATHQVPEKGDCGRAWVCKKRTPASHGDLGVWVGHGGSQLQELRELGGGGDFRAPSQRCSLDRTGFG